jgi:hypothetical protein
MINDGSTDDYMSVLKPFIDKQYVTLFDSTSFPKFTGRQGKIYDMFFGSILNQTRWLAILDMDEYLYSPKDIDLKNILSKHEDCGKLIVNWCWFNSNGHQTQPKSVVEGFTKRLEFGKKVYAPSPSGWSMAGTDGPKAIVNTSHRIYGFGVHDHSVGGITKNVSYNENISSPDLLINHYALQSREYWAKVKMPRGDADCWHSDTARDWKWFEALDVGDVVDTALLEQNKNMIKELVS